MADSAERSQRVPSNGDLQKKYQGWISQPCNWAMVLLYDIIIFHFLNDFLKSQQKVRWDMPGGWMIGLALHVRWKCTGGAFILQRPVKHLDIWREYE